MKKYILISVVLCVYSILVVNALLAFPEGLQEEVEELGLDINNLAAGDSNSLGQLLYCAAEDFPDYVSDILDAGADPNWHDADGDFPLLIAAGMGHLNAVESLCAADADVNAVNLFGESALHRAIQHKHFELA